MVKGATVPWRTGQHGQSSSFLQASPTTEESSQLCRSIEAQFQQTLPNHNIGSARRASNGPYGGWYRKSIPNDDVWRMACIPLNRGKERSSPASSTVSRPRQPYGSSDIPAAHSLASWHREWQENGGRLADRSLERCTLEQKRATVRHCLTHGRCNAFTRREPGCPKCTAKLAERIDEHAPSERRAA